MSVQLVTFIRLFGTPELHRGDTVVVMTRDRPHELLVLLACRRDWVHRDELAALFWPEHPIGAARSNLRKVLLLAARSLGDIATLERRGDSVRWRPDSDVARFELACDDLRWAEAIAAYGPPLLGAAAGYSAEWLVAEQARLDERWRAACRARIAQVAGNPAAVAKVAEQMLLRDPLDEGAISVLARALIEQRRNGDAAQTLASYRRQLMAQLGAEPSPALRDLDRQVQLAPVVPVPASVHGAPSFIGRRTELSLVAQLLENPAVRCIVLVGPGGVGKSALSRRIAETHAKTHSAALAWVPLEDLTRIDQVPTRIAQRLGLVLQGPGDTWSLVEAALRSQPPLLLLDNAEHLEIAPGLTRLLANCADLRLIVTSRVRLGVPTEEAVTLEGLSLPDDDEVDVEVLRLCDSVRLFEERALAADGRFDLALQAADVVQLVQMVEGFPLAIELAASWVRLLSVAGIIEDLRHSLELLDARPGRIERGVRASFEQSWRRLAGNERETLARLALLPGAFGRDLAWHVAEAPLPMLASFVDQSLVRAQGQGRFALHALIRQLAAERATDVEAIAQAHLSFVAGWLQPHTLTEAMPPAMLAAMDDDVPHLRAAWATGLRTKDEVALTSMSDALYAYFRSRALLDEGIEAFGAAAEQFAPSSRVRCLGLRALCGLHYLNGHTSAAEESARALLALEGHDDDPMLLMPALNTLGICVRQRGDEEEAESLFRRALQMAEATGAIKSAAIYGANLANTNTALGRYDVAKEGLEKAVALHRQANNIEGVVQTVCDLAVVHRALHQAAAALEPLNEALLLCRQLGLTFAQLTVMMNLGYVHFALGDLPAATRWNDRAFKGSLERQAPMVQVGSLILQAYLACGTGDFRAARGKVWNALEISRRMEWRGSLLQCVAALGEIVATQGAVAHGTALLRWCLAQKGFYRVDRDAAVLTLERLELLPGASLLSEPTILPSASLSEVLVSLE